MTLYCSAHEPNYPQDFVHTHTHNRHSSKRKYYTLTARMTGSITCMKFDFTFKYMQWLMMTATYNGDMNNIIISEVVVDIQKKATGLPSHASFPSLSLSHFSFVCHSFRLLRRHFTEQHQEFPLFHPLQFIVLAPAETFHFAIDTSGIFVCYSATSPHLFETNQNCIK